MSTIVDKLKFRFLSKETTNRCLEIHNDRFNETIYSNFKSGNEKRSCYNCAVDRPIELLQFLICRDFKSHDQDRYTAEGVLSNLYVPKFPYYFDSLFAVTCWRKDKRFHKEVLEYSTDYGKSLKTPHMDIEPVTNSVLFRWHKHQFPTTFAIERNTLLTIKVILDWKTVFQTYVMIEKTP